VTNASEWIGTGAAAKMLGVSRSTVRRIIDDGRLPVRRLPSGVRRIRREDVERLARELDREP
jgi:excisionase family DNA binding protein